MQEKNSTLERDLHIASRIQMGMLPKDFPEGIYATLTPAKDVGELPCDPNIPVGFMPEWVYTLQEAEIYSGTTIFLFTDGLTEAENINHELFAMGRVLKEAEKALANREQEPRKIIASMTEAVHQFVGEADQSDDLTMMAIQLTL